MCIRDSYGVYKEYQKQTNDQTKTILLSTASPYKFPSSVYQAVTGGILDEYEAIDALNEKTKVAIPTPLQAVSYTHLDVYKRQLHQYAIKYYQVVGHHFFHIKGQ